MICQICYKEYVALGGHIRQAHSDTTIKEYYDKFLRKETEGICKREGCGNPTTFWKLSEGYSECCSHSCSSIFNRNKIESTNLKRYGCRCSFQNENVKKKLGDTKIERYGNSNYNNAEKISSSLKQRTAEDKEIWADKVRERWNSKGRPEKDLIMDKRNKTFIERYSVNVIDNLFRGLKDYLLENNVDNPSQIKEVSVRMTKSIRERWSNDKEKILKKIRDTTMERYGYDHIMKDEDIKNRILEKGRASNVKSGHWLPSNLSNPFKKYRNRVIYLTRKNSMVKFTEEELRCVGKCGMKNALQVDHMFSIKQGFINGIPPEVIASEPNLRLIRWEDNDSKKDRCCITLEELIEMYK